MTPQTLLLLRILFALATALACADAVRADSGEALKARHVALQPVLAQNGFGRPLHVY